VAMNVKARIQILRRKTCKTVNRDISWFLD
jgi:hypothetical protein